MTGCCFKRLLWPFGLIAYYAQQDGGKQNSASFFNALFVLKMIIKSCLKCRPRSCFHLNYTVGETSRILFLFLSGLLKFWESRTSVAMSSDPISVCNFQLCDLSYWSYFYCFHKDAGWKPSFNTVHNGIPKQRQAGWVYTVSFNSSSRLHKCHTGLRPEETLLFWSVFCCFLQVSADPAQKPCLLGHNSRFQPKHAVTPACSEYLFRVNLQ